MVLCLIVGCGNKTGKEQRSAKEKRFFRVPRVITHQGEYTEEMTAERRRKWICDKPRRLNRLYFGN